LSRHSADQRNESADRLKEAAGLRAAEHVAPGMRVGLGTGSTAAFFLRALADRIERGELPGVTGVPTSVRTEEDAVRLGIPLAPKGEIGSVDLAVDGADEIAPDLGLIKGLGGALLREKVVAQAAARMIVIAEESKLVERLGERAPLPVELAPFGVDGQLEWLAGLGARPKLRIGEAGRPARTDNGNLTVDCWFERGIGDAPALERRLASRAGVVESGLFLDLAGEAIVSGDGGVRRIRRVEP